MDESPSPLQDPEPCEHENVSTHCAVELSHSVVSDSATPWTVAPQALLSMEFSRQAYWRGLPSPPPGDLPHPGIEPGSLMSPVLAGGLYTKHRMVCAGCVYVCVRTWRTWWKIINML